KTAAFAIPIIELLSRDNPRTKGQRPIRAIIMTPTRELAGQISDNIRAYSRFTNLRHAVVYGGVSQVNQIRAMRGGVDILVATPGRLLDLMDQGYIRLSNIEILVLDEADRMLDMGFIHDIKKIISAIPQERQTLFFSATMAPAAKELASSILRAPKYIAVAPESSTVDTVEQKIYFVEKDDKRQLLLNLLEDPKMDSVLVFVRTKYGADKMAKTLQKNGVQCDAIHGDKSQNARQKALDAFKAHKTRVLIATDIAARGIDVDRLSYVINYDLPNQAEDYVHRIGRTGRAGREGISISFCDSTEVPYFRDIRKLVGKDIIEMVSEQPFHCENSAEAAFAAGRTQGSSAKKDSKSKNQRSSRNQRSGSPRSKNGGERRTERAENKDFKAKRSERPERSENKERSQRSEKAERPQRSEKAEQRPEKRFSKESSAAPKKIGAKVFNGNKRYSASDAEQGKKRTFRK
ncbi:MAG: DEAD/DEAH box helicase, partial [Flavobacteriales bacterium]|nr:DEAD/DEAH box helicase [Flavobacteriales bacterium]